MLIAFHGIDRADAENLRAATRPAHIEFHATRDNHVGGPLRGESGAVCGTLIIFEAVDVESAAAEMSADPYMIAGLFETTTITEFIAVDWPATPPAAER